MRTRETSQLLGPFSATYEIRTYVGNEKRHYAFPVLRARDMSLIDSLGEIPGFGQAVARLYRTAQETPKPLVLATTLPCSGLQGMFPSMELSEAAAVYSIPAEWAPVASQLACQDADDMFGMPDLNMHGQRPRVARTLRFSADRACTKLFMDHCSHNELLTGCFGSEPCSIGRFVPQFVVCGQKVTYGGFFFDAAAYELLVCGITSMSGHAIDTTTEEYKVAQIEAALVGNEPWRYRLWPDFEGFSSWLLEATCV